MKKTLHHSVSLTKIFETNSYHLPLLSKLKYLKQIYFLFLFFTLHSCSKKSEFNQINELSKSEATKVVSSIVFSKVKNPSFKTYIESECMKQLNGDYMIPVDYIIKKDTKGFFSLEEKNKILGLLQPYDGENFGTWFSIYIPHLELKDTRYPIPTPKRIKTEKRLNEGQVVTNSEDPGNGSSFGDPIAVLPPENLPPSVESLPGYIIDRWGNFHFKANITEEDALHNDVWIFGFQEILCEEASRISDLDLADPYSGTQSVRMPGEMERAGFMQVMNGQLNNIRRWELGKLSMRLVILNQWEM